MHFCSLLLSFSPLLLGAAAEQFSIPAVEAAVSKALAANPNHKAYTGPTKQAPKFSPAAQAGVQPQAAASYWLEGLAHQGVAPYAPGGYSVWRSVKDYGAKGDGVTDDTAAIQAAISAGGRCGQNCASTTVTPALVYFPAGTYIVSSPIVDYYYTQLIGNANSLPVIKAKAGFSGGYIVDGDPYYTSNLNWGSTNVFYRQIKNFVFDTTAVAATQAISAIHWPTAQATSLQNILFQLSAASGTQHQGIFIESGSAGFLGDLTFNGGNIAAAVGNQQFTMRNLTFNNAQTAISHYWDWGWLYKSITINNCKVGIDISAGGRTAQEVGSVTLIDSTISNTPIGIKTAYDSSAQPAAAGSLIVENVALNNVPVAIQGPNGATALSGTSGSTTIAAWGEGHRYVPSGPQQFEGTITPNSRPAALLSGSKFYERGKPSYANLPASSFRSVRSAGAKGDGNTDDTTALQNVINAAASAGQVVFFDAGVYKITTTLTIPPNSKIVGEAYPVILAAGSFWTNINSPQPVVQVGSSDGLAGQVEWSDMIVSTQGAQAGATLIKWQLKSTGTPSGMWDVHTRVGGFTGSNLQVAQCPTSSSNANTANANCIAAYQHMRITAGSSGLYMENNWLWTADHDIDSNANTQITIFSGRGLLIESTTGTFWLSGTAVEHNALYQYQLANTQNIYMGFIQTETPYYQPNPNALIPFSPDSSRNDPVFSTSCSGKSGNCAAAWGLRILNSKNVYVYGAGLYSFFNNYSTTCSNQGGTEACQNSIFSIEGSSSAINVYCLSTIGSQSMIDQNGNSLARYSDNVNVFPDTIALFRLS